MHKAMYSGSFDPITYGHIDIIKRASAMFDELTVIVLNNSKKNSLFSINERVSMVQGVIKDNNLENVNVDTFDSLLVDYAKEKDINIIVRGLRAITDFEYELQIAQVNRVQLPGLETVFLTTSLNYSYLSSTIVREFATYGGDISKFVPDNVRKMVETKFKNKENH